MALLKKRQTRKLNEQVIVITGATSGIGLATALLAARKGARVVLASRNEDDLRRICDRINREGGHSTYEVADVARREDVERIARTAVEEFGGFDTWVNNAGVTIFGRLWEVPLKDERRLFDVNYWSVVHGSLTALDHLRDKGGTIINIGSVLSQRAAPMQGAYTASKHAVKAFTEALRMEIEKENLPVAVSLVKPASIDTPLPHHARNYMEEKATLPPPYYSPGIVARAILRTAVHPRRDVTVGSASAGLILGEKLFPRTIDRLMEATMFRLQKNAEASRIDDDGLYSAPGAEGETSGGYRGHVATRSPYTAMRLHPGLTAAIVAGMGVSAMATVQALRRMEP